VTETVSETTTVTTGAADQAVTAPFPLTDLQAGYLVGSSPLMELGGFRPNLYLELDVVGFDPARAERAIDQLILRHEHLRTVVLTEGEQRVLDPGETAAFRLSTVDLSGLAPDRREAAILATRTRMRDEGPDPTGWPLFEIVAQRVRPHRTRVHFAMSLLLLDSGSTLRLQDEWLRLYQDPSATLPPVTRSFRECVLSSAAARGTGAYEEHWRYWRDRLDDLPEMPRLPLAKQPGALGTVRLVRRTFPLSRDQWQRLRRNFRTHRVLPTTALLHVFAEVLGAWAETPRFCLNVLHQNWTTSHPEAEGVVGQFSQTLPLEVDLRGDGDFWARAGRLQRQLWKDLKHADVTGVRVTRELAARRGWTPRAALPYVFNSMLGPGRHDDAPRRPACRTVTSGIRTPQVLVDNQIQDGTDGGVVCVWDVVDDAFPPGLPDAMFAAYRSVLEQVAEPDGATSRPDPVPRAHRALVAGINAPAAVPPAGRLEDGFLRHAREAPDAPAVVTSKRALTYGQLEAASRAVAGWLGERGIGRGDIVPIVMAKGWEQVVAALGVLRAGAAYCPVDAVLPAERIDHLVGECSARAVLGQSHAPVTCRLPVLDVDLSRPGGEPAPERAGDPADLAYVIHTSGSTGRPKGVMIEHRAAVTTIAEVNRRVALAPSDRVFGVSSLSFDLSVWDVFGTLAAGAVLVLPDATSRPDPLGWAGAAAAHGVTVWNSVPALAEMLVEVAEQRPETGLAPIRAFLLSGDWVPTTLPDRMRNRWPDVRVISMGGATEAAIWSNVYEVARVDPAWRSIPYGTPLRGQTMTILDHRLDVRAPWAVGRIHIGGAGLARGYAGDEERTAERFIRHPVTGERLYWTGDLGRYWPDGTIEFLGREDRQLKIQGFRIEPGEVEDAIRSHPEVREAAVCAVAAPGGQRRLVALVVRRDGGTAGAEAITGHLRAKLPSYMVPGHVHLLGHLPLTSNGKVDLPRALQAVAAPSRDAADDAQGFGDDRMAGRLAELWSELLQVPRIGPDSDFFALGGNSLLALRLLNRVRAEFGSDLRFGQIFEAPTVRALAARIREGGRAASCAVGLSEGSGRELFLFHPVGGSVSGYVDLARAWPGPVRAFQSRAFADEDAALDPDLATMARAYREELQRLAPDGPYLLGGWSMGGVLAYEVGGQLAEQGHRCAVIMIDSTARGNRSPGTEAGRHVEFLTDLARGALPAPAASAVRTSPGTARDVAVELGLLPPEVDPAGYERLMRVHAHNLAVLAAHRPVASGLPTLLINAADGVGSTADWREVCPGIDIEVLTGDHHSIVAADRIPEIVGRVTGWLGANVP
jgi:amino acid adenylation domain-containing protein